MTTLANDTKPSPPPRRPRRLIVFARYPESGKAKTRLIPALGAEGAAALQDEMTRFTLARLAGLRSQGTQSEVRYAGADEPAMRARYGPGWRYRPQPAGDLGTRLTAAVAEAFAEGCAATVLIGTDCPDLTLEIVESAFAALATAEVVIGPAADGGYYLIGQRRSIAELFQGIPWSTVAVLKATLQAAERLRLRVSLLPELRDVDNPEDLDVWRRAQTEE